MIQNRHFSEAIPENSPQLHEPLQRKASGGALPKPPVSNVASGWNDPPPIMVKSKVRLRLVARLILPSHWQLSVKNFLTLQ